MTEDLQWIPATTVSTTCTENALVARVCDLDVTDVAPARGGRVSDNRVSIWGGGEVMLQQYGTAITASSWTLTCPSPWASHSITLDQSDVNSLFSGAALPPDLAARLDAA